MDNQHPTAAIDGNNVNVPYLTYINIYIYLWLTSLFLYESRLFYIHKIYIYKNLKKKNRVYELQNHSFIWAAPAPVTGVDFNNKRCFLPKYKVTGNNKHEVITTIVAVATS